MTKETLLRWHDPSIPLGHETRRPQAAGVCTPSVGGVQLHLERSLVLLHHVLEGHGGVFRVLPLCALPTHGGLTGLAVEVHHLRVTQERLPFSAWDWALTRRWVFPSVRSAVPTASPGCGECYIQRHRRKGKINFCVPGLKHRWIGLQSSYRHRPSCTWPLP